MGILARRVTGTDGRDTLQPRGCVARRDRCVRARSRRGASERGRDETSRRARRRRARPVGRLARGRAGCRAGERPDPVRLADGHRASAGAQAGALAADATRRRVDDDGRERLRPRGPGPRARRAGAALDVRGRRGQRGRAGERAVALPLGRGERGRRALRRAASEGDQVRRLRVRQPRVRRRALQRRRAPPGPGPRQAGGRARAAARGRGRELGADGGAVPRVGGQARREAGGEPKSRRVSEEERRARRRAALRRRSLPDAEVGRPQSRERRGVADERGG